MRNNGEKTKAKSALVLSGICNTISALIHLAIIIIFIIFAVSCWNCDATIYDAVEPSLSDAVGAEYSELVTPIVLRAVFIVAILFAFDALCLFVLNLSVAIDCYSNSRKTPIEAYACKKGIGWCGFFELLGALVFAAIAVLCILLPDMVSELAEMKDALQYGLIAGAVIAGLLLICAIIKFCASSVLGRERRKSKKQ